jgi:ferredoxin
MNKTKITVATVGYIPAELDRQKIKYWKSDVFFIEGGIESYSLPVDSDGLNWEFTDSSLEDILPNQFAGEILLAVVNVPIENNWYSRRLSNNRIVFTFYEIKEILFYNNFPLENIIYRMLYAYTLLYKRSDSRIPLGSENTNLTHDETRGCLHDMTANKIDIIYSCHEPIICSDCVERLRKGKVSNEILSKVEKEIKKIKKPLFYRIAGFVKKHPIWSLAISAISALILGIIGSLIASIILSTMSSV